MRGLFSGGGFSAQVCSTVEKHNATHPRSPILLLQPTPKLFGQTLCASLKAHSRQVATLEGHTQLDTPKLELKDVEGKSHFVASPM